ncbi:MAG: CpsD/CapB family tyrosine-protein kinase [Pseudomonadota bacterium]
MERIKQALERAEKDRKYQPQTDRVVEALPPTGRGNVPVESGEDRDIQFEVTRSIPVDGKTLERNRIRPPGADDEVARAYDLLASRVVDRASANGWNSIAVVSPVGGDGKSVTALNLAIRLVASPARTCLLVDLDFRRPKIAEYLGVSPQYGIEDVLRAKASVSETLFSPGIPRLSVLPVRQPVDTPGGLIDSMAASELAQEAKQRYANRIVLFDMPPVLGSGDTVHFLRNVDAVLVIAASGRTSESAIQETLSTLAGHNVVGCVLNCAEDTLTAY